MKKHFVTVKISFLTFFCHCIKQYPSIRFCAVSMTDQAVSAFLSKDRLQKKFAENIVIKRKRKQLLKNIRCDQKLIPDTVLIWMNKMSCIRRQKNKGISGQKKRMPPQFSKTASSFYTIKLKKGMIVAAFCSRRILDDRYLMVGRK